MVRRSKIAKWKNTDIEDMEINNQYELSEPWADRLRKYISSYYRAIYFGPPSFLFLNFLFCYSFVKEFDADYWIMFTIMSVASTAFCIYFPTKAIRRYKNIVRDYTIDNERLNLTLIDNRNFIISQYELRDTLFRVGNNEKTAKVVISNSDDNYYIIPDFSK